LRLCKIRGFAPHPHRWLAVSVCSSGTFGLANNRFTASRSWTSDLSAGFRRHINLAELYDAETKVSANLPFIPSSVNRDFPNFAREKPEFEKKFSWVKGKAVKKNSNR
jgi:hypothetical protein